ncbi:hypothetical protein SAMN06297251_10446 [Fulvimarina manganoxydans]|uniref:Uncharacterized protein n=1 Tax=Fulvimarina manganoxydans TaxID=937218 RepID=A0A1W2A9M4_9HYPH|nr:hypothetical protein [Fulvimarina manganoxydans]SMC57344.1 hypothetical protein SAMN06297251_10446 [Fulvimarina manganoxydans]
MSALATILACRKDYSESVQVDAGTVEIWPAPALDVAALIAADPQVAEVMENASEVLGTKQFGAAIGPGGGLRKPMKALIAACARDRSVEFRDALETLNMADFQRLANASLVATCPRGFNGFFEEEVRPAVEAMAGISLDEADRIAREEAETSSTQSRSSRRALASKSRVLKPSKKSR